MGHESPCPHDGPSLHHLAKTDLAVLNGPHHGLNSSRDPQSSLRRFHMLVHGALANTETLTNVPIALSLCRQAQTLAFAPAEHGGRLEPVFSLGSHVLVVSQRRVKIDRH